MRRCSRGRATPSIFFLQIQGSGQVRLENGERMRVGYADQNGHPYRSLGRHLVERGEMKLEEASMQGIKAWAAANPQKLQEALNQNASYVFFRELPTTDGPIGALGVPLHAQVSLAVDRRFVPLGAPVYLATTYPLSPEPLERLMTAHDTGGAIRGVVRADFYWGTGPEAGVQAGRMRQQERCGCSGLTGSRCRAVQQLLEVVRAEAAGKRSPLVKKSVGVLFTPTCRPSSCTLSIGWAQPGLACGIFGCGAAASFSQAFARSGEHQTALE